MAEVAGAGAEGGAAGDPAELDGGVVGPVTGPDVLGVLTGVVAPVTGGADELVELVEEVQAVNSTAIQPSDAQAAICRGLGAFVILMMSKPSNAVSGSASNVTSTTLVAVPRLEPA